MKSFNEIKKLNNNDKRKKETKTNKIGDIILNEPNNSIRSITRNINILMSIDPKFITTILIAILTFLGFSMLTPYITLFGREIGMPAVLIGSLIFIRYGIDGISRIPMGNVADIISRPKVMIIGSTLLISSAIFYLLAPIYWKSLIVAQILFGVGMSTMLVSLSSYVTSNFSSEGISKYTFATGVGTFSGSFLGGTIKDYFGMENVFMVFLGLTTSVLFLSIYLYRKQRAFKTEKYNMNPVKSYVDAYSLFNEKSSLRRVTLLSLVFITTFTIGLAIVPIYYESIGMSSTYIGILQGLWLGTSTMIRLTSDKVIRTIDNISTSITGILITGIALTLMTFTQSFFALALISIFWGISGLNLPAIFSEISRITNQKEKGKANGLRGTVGSIGASVGVIIVSKLTSSIGIMSSIRALGITVMIIAVILSIGWKHKAINQTFEIKKVPMFNPTRRKTREED